MKKALGIVISLLFFCGVVNAASTKIEDRTSSGYKADVEKLGVMYGLSTASLPATTIYNGKVTTNAGTRVQLNAASVPVRSVTVKALSTNTGIVYVGNATVAAANGRELQAGEALDIDINNLNVVYVDVEVNGEGVTYLGIN